MPLVDNYSLDSYGLDGPYGGRKFASGFGYNLGDKRFLYSDGTAFTCGYISVNSLDFLPSQILITYGDDEDFILGYNSKRIKNDYPVYNGLRLTNSGSTIWDSFRVEDKSAGRAFITNSGFQLPLPYFTISPQRSFYWRAYE
ncbi:hypothetical protein [Paenibacillus amylolyticus]|uniref:hypothetical protein n=1 Tax=Paenibacillus amylolyticus TaxID=1451 RepID=UPI00201E23FB|nr:hypothetical protein [Paenibacillus amylolyticus]MCL6660354.1 hypothetical protein [Paenibacillus amylolyticus]